MLGKLISWALSGALAPLIKGGLDAYKLKLDSTNNHEAKIEQLAIKSIELDAQEARLNAERKRDINGRWYAPENLLFYFIAFPYWFTVITLDFLIFPAMGIEHAVDPLKGDTAAAMAMIMGFWLGKRTIGTIGQIVERVFGKR